MTSNDRRVYDELSSSGIPGCRMAWGPHPPECPRFTYTDASISHYADNTVCSLMPHYHVDLYLTEWDEDLVCEFRKHVARLGTYSTTEDWDRESKCIVVGFDFFLLRHVELMEDER